MERLVTTANAIPLFLFKDRKERIGGLRSAAEEQLFLEARHRNSHSRNKTMNKPRDSENCLSAIRVNSSVGTPHSGLSPFIPDFSQKYESSG